MKKTINHIYVLLLVATVFVASCSKDFLDKKPFDSVSIDQALSTEAGLGNALNGVYARLRDVGLYGRDFPVIGDLLADNTFVEVRNSGRYISQYNYSFIAADGTFDEIWRRAYNGIMGANQIINANVTGGNIAAIKAQAYAIRGLLYFKLVTTFAKPYTDEPNAMGVPIILTYDPYKLPGRSKVSEVYAQIVSDLQAGFNNGPDYSSSITLSKYAIEGLLAKVYLYMGDNTKAKSSALDVINNGGFSLVSAADYNNYWQDPAPDESQTETLFEIDADVVNNNGFDDLGGIYSNGYQDIYASAQLVSLYTATDVRASLIVAGNTKSGATAFVVNKYPNAQNDDRDNIKVMRLSEVYLIAAEASLPGNEADAKTYVNDIASLRDPSFAGYTSTGPTLLADIITERRKELAFEGDRFYDLNRLKLPIVRQQNAGAIPAGPANAFLTIPYPDNKRVAPIPQTEIQSNATIAGQQNPGY